MTNIGRLPLFSVLKLALQSEVLRIDEDTVRCTTPAGVISMNFSQPYMAIAHLNDEVCSALCFKFKNGTFCFLENPIDKLTEYLEPDVFVAEFRNRAAIANSDVIESSDKWLDMHGKVLQYGDIIDIHQTVNGQNRFVVVDIKTLDIRYEYDLSRKYEYDPKELLKAEMYTNEPMFEIVDTIKDKRAAKIWGTWAPPQFKSGYPGEIQTASQVKQPVSDIPMSMGTQVISDIVVGIGKPRNEPIRIVHLSIRDEFSLRGEDDDGTIYHFERKTGRTYLISNNQIKKWVGHTTKVIKHEKT